jgi:hypothetical protein
LSRTVAPKLEAGEQPDSDLREIQFKKANYAKLGVSIKLRYQNGLFLPLHGMSNIEKAAREAEIEKKLIAIGKKLIERGQQLSPMETSHSYAPTLIAKQCEAKGFRKAEFKEALERLLDRKLANIETIKPGTSREKSVIVFT